MTPDVIPLCREKHPELTPIGGGLVACHVAVMRAQANQAIREWSSMDHEEKAGRVFFEHARGSDTSDVVLCFDAVHKTYRKRRGLRVSTVQAVNNVSFDLHRGRVTALVGRSSSGKSTIARLVTGVERPNEGENRFGDVRADLMRGRALRDYRKHVQLVFQDPISALNPAHPVLYSLMRPLINHRGMSAATARERARELLETVGLYSADNFVNKHPHQRSGGQRQRVVVARALAPDLEIIIADEPISMRDVSIRAEILGLLDGLVQERGIAMLYITHDLLSAR